MNKSILFSFLTMLSSSLIAKVVLITGIAGQDGSYLADFLLEKGYEVHGLVRDTSNLDLISHLINPEFKIKLHYGDLTDPDTVNNLLEEIKPHEIYNLAAQSHVAVSFEEPAKTFMVNTIGALNILEAIRKLNLKTKFFEASTSEIFGKGQQSPQNENSLLAPKSPYGLSKLAAYWTTKTYRETYKIFACSGILFNHESSRRGKNFVTRKITSAIAEIANGSKEPISLGNIDAKRDWGYAGDYVEAMWKMLQQDDPKDYVIATGTTHTVREFIEAAFKAIKIEIEWNGSGVDEVGLNKLTKNILVKINPVFFRPVDPDLLVGDISRIKEKLGWSPKTTFVELVKLMVEADLKRLEKPAETNVQNGAVVAVSRS